VSDTVDILLFNDTLYNIILKSNTKLHIIFETSVVGQCQMEKATFCYFSLLYLTNQNTGAWIVPINAIIQNLFSDNLEWNLWKQVAERASPQERSRIQAPSYYDSSISNVLGKIKVYIWYNFFFYRQRAYCKRQGV
jgi:hypothetical protein